MQAVHLDVVRQFCLCVITTAAKLNSQTALPWECWVITNKGMIFFVKCRIFCVLNDAIVVINASGTTSNSLYLDGFFSVLGIKWIPFGYCSGLFQFWENNGPYMSVRRFLKLVITLLYFSITL